MGINYKKFQRMTPDQRCSYRRNVMRLHRSMSMVGLIGMIMVGLSLIFAIAA